MQQLLSEGNSKLTDTLKKKDNAQVVVVHAIISFALSKLLITQTELSNIMAELHNIKRPANCGIIDQRPKKQTVNTTEKRPKKPTTSVLNEAKILAVCDSSKSSTKRSAESRSDDTVSVAEK